LIYRRLWKDVSDYVRSEPRKRRSKSRCLKDFEPFESKCVDGESLSNFAGVELKMLDLFFLSKCLYIEIKLFIPKVTETPYFTRQGPVHEAESLLYGANFKYII
jgi:hypothetical protein